MAATGTSTDENMGNYAVRLIGRPNPTGRVTPKGTVNTRPANATGRKDKGRRNWHRARFLSDASMRTFPNRRKHIVHLQFRSQLLTAKRRHEKSEPFLTAATEQ